MNVFVDANVIIKSFTESADASACRNVIREYFITNTLCLLEAYHAIKIIKNDEEYARECMRSLYRSHASIEDVGRDLLFEALKRISGTPLTIFDCIHYTTAFLHNCTAIYSYDKDFDGLLIPRQEPQ